MIGKFIAHILTGGLADKIIGVFDRYQDRQIAAMNDEQRRTHELRMQERAAMKEIRLATAGYWEMRLLTFLIAAPFVWHLWLVGFDTMYPQPWNVEAWPSPFDEWEGAILLSFFGIAGGVTAVRAVAVSNAVKRRNS